MATLNSGQAPATAPAPTSTSDPARLPSPPFIEVPGLANLRDAGRYEIGSRPGRVIRPGVLFRSADLQELGDPGVATLQQLGVTHVFDLRSAKELKELEEKGKQPARTWEGATRIFVPVFLDVDYSPEAIALRFGNYSDGPQGFVKAYAAILASAADERHPHKPFRTILEHLASPTVPSPVLVHCTAGKDRTGVIIALILSLCGLEDDAVAAEYSLTDLGFATRKKETVQRLAEGPFKGDKAKAEMMVSSLKESMLETLKFIRQEYGSVEDYVVKNLGVSQESVEQIRRNLVVELAPGEKALDWRSLAGLKKKEPHL